MNKKEIYLAGGCFWGMQGYFDKIKGTLKTEVGYLNGDEELTTYKKVCNDSGHAEVLKLTYDQDVLKDSDVFKLYMRVIEPYSVNKQGGDTGIQYRTGVYSYDESLNKSFRSLLVSWEEVNKKSTIEMVSIRNYCKAELSHQKYLEKTPGGYCHINLHNIPEEYSK